jgi:glycosyltransferase involved in cell wall biosynthesis
LRVIHAVRSDSFAGVERHVTTLARAERARGHDVAVVGGDPSRMQERLAGIGPWLPATTVREVSRALQGLGAPDIVHVHMTAAEAAALLVPALRGVPLVATRHFAAPRGATRSGRMVAPLLQRRVSRQIAVSAYVADRIDGPSTVVLAGLETTPEPPKVSDRQPVVLVAQRLVHEKDTETALRAFAETGLATRGWHLALAGAGVHETRLRTLTRELGLDESASFLGRRSDIESLMRRSSMLVAPAPAEHFGLAVVEAMAAGLPVVATGSAGHLESIGRVETARLFAPGDAEAAAAHMVSLADDGVQRGLYAAEARRVQQMCFTASRQAAEVEAVYLECLR